MDASPKSRSPPRGIFDIVLRNVRIFVLIPNPLNKRISINETSYAQAQGGHPQYLVPAAGVLLKLATFDRIVTESKQYLLSIT